MRRLNTVGIPVSLGLGGCQDSDPFQGDHFADDWQDALAMVEEYARLVPAKEAP